MATLREKISRVLQDNIAVAPYDPRWPQVFEDEKNHLLKIEKSDKKIDI